MAADCRACGAEKSVSKRSIVWRVLAVAFWVPMLALGVCCALLLPLNLVLVPCWVACACAVGPLARKASEVHCHACGVSAEVAANSFAEVPRRDARPAHERAMEGALVREANA